MRFLALFLGTCLALTLRATPMPLSLRDVSLMLRSGYSSESVLREIQQRHVLDPLDPATRKTLVDVGASAELVRALEQGDFRVDHATAENARQIAANTAAHQEAEAEKAFRDATAVLRAQRAQASGNPLSTFSIAGNFQDKLVVCRDGVVTPADKNALENKKLFAFYFSAHWCAPCRKFTPGLVDYYNRVAPQHPEFALIFVSSDRSRFNWETYLRDAKMPWLAIEFDQLDGFAALKQLGGESIPSLLVIDATGHVVASSYDGDKYVGPQNALAALDKIFASGSQVAQAR